jgi:hypothetical protein
MNLLAVDVDSVFLQNPFARGNGLFERPNDIAVVADKKPFTFRFGDKTPINGGFLYFPGKQSRAAAFSLEVLEAVWSRNCHPDSNVEETFSLFLFCFIFLNFFP